MTTTSPDPTSPEETFSELTGRSMTLADVEAGQARVRDVVDQEERVEFDDEPGEAPTADEVAAFLETVDPPPFRGNAGEVRRGKLDDPWPSHFELDRWVQRPAWHSVATPLTVEKTWDDLLAAREHYDEVRDALDNIVTEQGAEQRDAVAAAEAGRKIRATDWATARIERRARVVVALRKLREAHAAYGLVVTEAAPAWRKAIGAEVAKRRAVALDALQKAAPAWQEWRSLVAAQEGIVRALDPYQHDRLVHLDGEAAALRAHGVTAMDAALALAASEHPVLAGTVFDLDDGSTVPDHVRQWAVRDGGDSAAMWLASLELSEGYSVSAYARGLAPVIAPFIGDTGRVLPEPWAKPVRRVLDDYAVIRHAENSRARRSN